MSDVKISLKDQPTVKCETCGGVIFREVTLIKKVSKLLTGSSEDTLVPFPTYVCDGCGFMNEDFKILGDD
jgi:hypothetical protein